MKHVWKLLSGSGNREEEQQQEIAWNPLETVGQLDRILGPGRNKPQLIFKHSTRCGISAVMLRRLERNWSSAADSFDFYLLDVLSSRQVSNALADRMGLRHESPQVLLIERGTLIKSTSHSGIAHLRP